MNNRRFWSGINNSGSRWSVAAIAATVFLCGIFWQHAGLLGCGAVVLCLVLRRVGNNTEPQPRRRQRRPSDKLIPNDGAEPDEAPRRATRSHLLKRPDATEFPKSADGLVDELLANERYALLLRPETKQHLTQLHIVRAVRQLDEAMALVPAGRVLLGQLAEQSNSSCGAVDTDPKMAKRNLVSVEPVYLDRFVVTNQQYQQFLDAGGYEQLEFWHEEALPALLDFVDQTGAPGPRFWSDGQYLPGEQRLPVVGVSWYEAWAYARWVGKRLPTDAEWTKAGAWPVESSPGRIAQRRYPWGESFDIRRAHLYGSGNTGPVAVDEFPGGTSVGGIHQLIGNVWEWTSTPLVELGDPTLHVSEAVMSIRGGAFDTYFENQATCHYQSGEHPLSRRPNIGFRLALPMSDLEVAEVANDDDAQGAVDETVTDPSESQDVAVTC
ncbi:MAG: SUMF1/EgtB/PvdO family nonheme iron enzyme [Pirellulales bacterium]